MRRCPDETIQDYLDNDLLRICQPARYGGFEHGYDVLCEVAQTLARGCGAQAWVHMVLTDNILKLASYSDAGAGGCLGQGHDREALELRDAGRQGPSGRRRRDLVGAAHVFVAASTTPNG